MLTAFFFINEDCSLRHSDIYNRNATLEGSTGGERLVGTVVTLKSIVDSDGMGLSDITLIKLYNLTTYCRIVTITGNCVRKTLLGISIDQYRNILAVPSTVLTARVKGLGAPVDGWLKTLITSSTSDTLLFVWYITLS